MFVSQRCDESNRLYEMADYGNILKCGFIIIQHCSLLLKNFETTRISSKSISPSVKSSGFFYFDSVGLARPEITHYRNRLTQRYDPPANAKVLFLVPQTRNKPFHKAPEFKKIRQLLRGLGEEIASKIHICVYCAPFGSCSIRA